jgi:glutamine synthetase
MTSADVLKLIKKENVVFVDLRFTDTKGKEQHVTVPTAEVDKTFLKEGKMFDGSSIAGWKFINESDMILMPDIKTSVLDIFAKHKQLNIRCDVIEPLDGKGYERCPRTCAKRALAYLKSTKIADNAFFGPENEFFVFDDVKFGSEMQGAFYEIHSEEASWVSGHELPGGNLAHRPGIKGGYFPVPPVDSLNDLRGDMCVALNAMALYAEVHHHEVATAGQCEIGVGAGSLVDKADQVQVLKYVVHNVAHRAGKTATFMPKPLVGDNGNGMHVHQSLIKNGKNLFGGNEVGGISQTALYYIGGIIKHARALCAFTNSSTNSYKRLVPGFEAPTILTYSARNRSASIRIPFVADKNKRRVEVRFPDNTANPYLAFTAMMMAGLDGIQNKIDPGKPIDKDLYTLTEKEESKLKTVASSFEIALDALDKDRKFLTAGGVMTDDMIDAYIALKMEEVTELRQSTHPVEFQMYYSC